MKRRQFIQAFGALGALASVPNIFHNQSFIRSAHAALTQSMIDTAGFVAPARLPQIINVFLYGGPSELAGNLTNIADINANSQNPYTVVSPNILKLSNDVTGGQITRHGFWLDAGGQAMEDMLATGDMTIYRTINRRKDNTLAHRNSIFSSQKGTLDIEMSGGVGTTIASVLYANKNILDGSALLGGRQLEEMILPFVSFEGDSTAFAADATPGAILLPLQLRSVSLDQNFANPYARAGGIADQAALDALVNKMTAVGNTRFQKVSDSFSSRASLEPRIAGLQANLVASLPNIGIGATDADVNGVLTYPVNSFSQRMKAAVTLAMQNPDSLYISIGGSLGGWDDHDNAIEKYEQRMTDLMTTLRVAAKHIRLGLRPGNISSNNIIINVHGDFGRNVNLNGSLGWDHGNNQNFYTIGGAGVRQGGVAALGKIVGKTERFGNTAENRQFTRPTDDSYEAEPMSIAATVYKYFGVQNPSILTASADMNDPEGSSPLDETVGGEPALF
ncbi:MAG: DUF1501 domain-containing protein [Gammaproteobacteria bacterium]|nr:DUF1501 domain-containing protein [Gammaproteobacteria bacterium]